MAQCCLFTQPPSCWLESSVTLIPTVQAFGTLGNSIFRIFCFFAKGKIVVLANGFQKKTQKTPKHKIN